MEEQSKVEVTYTDFLKAIESPQFRNNSEKIYDYLKQTADSSRIRSRIIATCRRECLYIVWALQDLLFLRDIRSTGKITGKDYTVADEELLRDIAASVEADYLNKLLEIEKVYKRRRTNPDKAEEIRKPISQIWLDDEADDDMPLKDYVPTFNANRELELHESKKLEKFLLDWIERIVNGLPYSDAIDLAGRPIPLESINQQVEQIETTLINATDLLDDFQDSMIDEFLETLLNSRIAIDNKLYRDIYNVLLLYNRLPEDLVKSHNNNAGTNRYVRENYIKQRVYRMIEQEPGLKLWYKTILKSFQKK